MLFGLLVPRFWTYSVVALWFTCSQILDIFCLCSLVYLFPDFGDVLFILFDLIAPDFGYILFMLFGLLPPDFGYILFMLFGLLAPRF
jgi:hypothetical protein